MQEWGLERIGTKMETRVELKMFTRIERRMLGWQLDCVEFK